MKRSMTKKMVVIALLITLLMIPLMMIKGVVNERSSYRYQVKHDISQSWTGEQSVVGPLLVVPYKEYYSKRVWDKELKQYRTEKHHWKKQLYIAPEQLTVVGDVVTTERNRGIYSIPVYKSELTLSGHYSNKRLQELLQSTSHKIEWESAHLSVLISDVRGVTTTPLLGWHGGEMEFLPGSELPGARSGMHAGLGRVDVAQPRFDFSFTLPLRGMERLQFSPIGKSTEVRLSADWPHPSFIGRYLPEDHKIDAEKFTARWNLSSFSSGMPQLLQECEGGDCQALLSDTFGVTLFNSVDIYQQSERSVKYAMLFIGLTFITFFLFEVMKGLRLHPMQYLLVGLGLSLFYLLLVSLSEHIAFALAYLAAALASTGVIGFYLSGVLQSLRSGGVMSAALLLLYGMLFAILQSEDNALLMGSLLIFAVLTLVMVVTRRIDWYAIGESMAQVEKKEQTLALDI
ncbi:MAG: cell envelope integrity protein CreD [Chromatiales bacterium]|nr:cell envelope integrity protein CreD [Chromatiales bacterium]